MARSVVERLDDMLHAIDMAELILRRISDVGHAGDIERLAFVPDACRAVSAHRRDDGSQACHRERLGSQWVHIGVDEGSFRRHALRPFFEHYSAQQPVYALA